MSLAEHQDDHEMEGLENIAGKFVFVPPRIKKLKRNAAGYPVPFFVEWIEGAPDFRVVSRGKIEDCVLFKLCWICGDKLGSNKAFVVGPMCAINRTSSEPPSHRECAIFATKVCPFMVNPEMRRRETNLPDHNEMPGVGLKRNPGVSLIWMTHDYKCFQVEMDTANGVQPGVLFKMGEPDDMIWMARGQEATAEQIAESIESGIPSLMAMAEQQGPEAVEALNELHNGLLEMIPGMKPIKPRKIKVEG